MPSSSPPNPPPDQNPLPRHHDEHPDTISRNSRYGLVLFAIYLVLYGGFMLLSAFAPQKMAAPAIAGVNLAIVYGIGLIIGALVLAAIYMYLCRQQNGSASGAAREVGK